MHLSGINLNVGLECWMTRTHNYTAVMDTPLGCPCGSGQEVAVFLKHFAFYKGVFPDTLADGMSDLVCPQASVFLLSYMSTKRI